MIDPLRALVFAAVAVLAVLGLIPTVAYALLLWRRFQWWRNDRRPWR